MVDATRMRLNGSKRELILVVILAVGCLALFAVFAKTSAVLDASTDSSPIAQAKIWADRSLKSPDVRAEPILIGFVAAFAMTLCIMPAVFRVPPVPAAGARLHQLFDSSEHWLRPPPQA